jgi:hypothetical protein
MKNQMKTTVKFHTKNTYNIKIEFMLLFLSFFLSCYDLFYLLTVDVEVCCCN